MKSEDLGSYQRSELYAHVRRRDVHGLGDDRFVHHFDALAKFNSCGGNSLPKAFYPTGLHAFGLSLAAEALARFHQGPDDPRELVCEGDRDEARRLFCQERQY